MAACLKQSISPLRFVVPAARPWHLAGLLFALALCPIAAPMAWGQEDPFGGDAADPFGAPPAEFPPFGAADDAGGFGDPSDDAVDATAPPADGAAAAPDEPSGPRSVVVQQLRRYAMRGSSDRQLAFAIREAIRLGDVPLAQQFLAELTARNLDQSRLAAVAQQIDVALLARVRGYADLDAAAIAQINALRAAAAASASDRAALRQWIAQLDDPSVDVRLAAMRGLLAGGDAAIAEMAAAAASPAPPAPRMSIADVLSRMGSGGFEAAEQLALYGSDEYRPGALATLVRIDRQRSIPELVAALHARLSTTQERQIADASLRSMLGDLPGPRESESYLLAMLERAVDAVDLATQAAGVESLWTIESDGQTVAALPVDRRLAAQRRAVDAARRVRRLGDLASHSLVASLTTDLAYRLQVDPLFGSAADAQAISEVWGAEALAADVLSSVLTLALDQRRHDAAIAAMRLMDVADAHALVVSQDAAPTALVVAAQHPEPRVRYEAATTIARLAVDAPYAGSSQVLQRWLEMARLQQQPTVLLVEPRLSEAQGIESLLSEMGYQVQLLRTVAELVQRVDAGGDIQWIVASTQQADAPAIELVDRVRRRPLGGAVPILFYGPPAAGTDADRWTAAVEQIAPPRSAAALGLAMRPVLQNRDLEPLTAAERQLFAIAGIEALAAIATDGGRYGFYDLRSAGAEAVVGGDASPSRPEHLAVLSALGTPQSQATLAGLAARSVLSIDARRQAARAFAESVQRFGTRLSRRDVAAQYDRYNRMQDPAGREAMAVVLDAIERRAGVTTRPLPD